MKRESNCGFQFTRPRGARPTRRTNYLVSSGFNSRAREGRDQRIGRHTLVYCVSIHAPARGATERSANANHARRFNSRAREGRDRAACRRRFPCRFQFTRPRGARPKKRLDFLLRFCVSIHAPARGATIPRHTVVFLYRLFQFTRPRGARPYLTD